MFPLPAAPFTLGRLAPLGRAAAISWPAVAARLCAPYSRARGRGCVVRDYMVGNDADVIVASLGPKVHAEYPDWAAPELIDFAIRYYSTLS